MMMEKLKVLDLFSGIGGFSLGLERTGGFVTTAFCEIEPFPRKVLAKHWPDVPCFHDVRTLTASDVGPIDVITGGFPCQDISLAGKQAGLGTETRSGLWSEIVRLVGELRPSFVIVENVANLLAGPSDRPGGWFGRILGDLAEIGYDACWNSISASALGACHHRDRVWIVAYPQQIGEGRKADARFAAFLSKGIAGMAKGWEKGIYPNAWKEREQGGFLEPIPRIGELSWGKNCRSVEEIIDVASVYTPALCRANDGISNRVDRTAALGNAVIPQIPELIGRAILDAINPQPDGNPK